MRDKTSWQTTEQPDLPGTLDRRRIELLAHEFWRVRGCPEGSPEFDWFLAEEQLRREYGLVAMAHAA